MNAAVKPVPMPAPRAVSFKAWRLPGGKPGYEAVAVEVPAHVETIDEAAQLACLHHKEGVLVLRVDAAERPERRNLVSIFVVKRKAYPGSYRDADGKRRNKPAEYPALVAQFCVAEGFEPVEPWKWSPGVDTVGADLTLVEQG